jgi:Cu/Zn superoxide dismutase
VASAAQQNGYNDANSQNSFGFHVCDAGSCTKTMCSGSNCNNSLTYFDFAKPHGYTLCRK